MKPHAPSTASREVIITSDHRAAIGGMWDEIGELQYQFLLTRGLQPHHRLLDIGCGALRGGVRFMRYLDPGHYFAIEKEPLLIEAGREEMRLAGMEERRPHIVLTDDFDLSAFGDVLFDYMLAQSVFTHLVPEMIARCLERGLPALAPAGRFFATFFESPDARNFPGVAHPFRRGEMKRSVYSFDMFQELASLRGAAVTNLGNWNHPRGQRMLMFERL